LKSFDKIFFGEEMDMNQIRRNIGYSVIEYNKIRGPDQIKLKEDKFDDIRNHNFGTFMTII
jgi:hypothetical protein